MAENVSEPPVKLLPRFLLFLCGVLSDLNHLKALALPVSVRALRASVVSRFVGGSSGVSSLSGWERALRNGGGSLKVPTWS